MFNVINFMLAGFLTMALVIGGLMLVEAILTKNPNVQAFVLNFIKKF